jgi:hypothetical protein
VRALKSVVLISMVLVLFGTVMPVSAGQQVNLPPEVECYWRYQVPLPRPDAAPVPPMDEATPNANVQSVSFIKIIVVELQKVLLGRVYELGIR